MEWWYWVIAALVLFALEALTPGGFVLFFLGAGALIVGALASAEILDAILWQVLAFSIASAGLLLGFRGHLLQRFTSPRTEVDSLVGEKGTLLGDLLPGQVGKIEFRGSVWNARTERTALADGQRCRVIRVDGLTLWVEADAI